MTKHIYILTLIVFASTTICLAQKKPIKNEQSLKKELFELNAYHYNHSFKATLPDDNFLLIDFYKLSFWPNEENVVNEIFDVARRTVQQVMDSFKSGITSKRIDIHMPIKGSPLSVRLKEHNDGTDLLVLQYGQQFPLKLGMDTINILKTTDVGEGNKKGKVQYRIILKDLENINELSQNKTLAKKINNNFDSIINSRRERWKDQDVWYHEIDAEYNPYAAQKDDQLNVRLYRPGFMAGVDVDYYIGAALFRNTIAPVADVGASYRWHTHTDKYGFFKLSLSTMPLFERQSEQQYDIYHTSFIKAEIGTKVNKTNTWMPLYETSLGFGYMMTDHPSLKDHRAGKIFWNFSLSPAIRITPELIVLFRKKQENIAWPGISVSLRVF